MERMKVCRLGAGRYGIVGTTLAIEQQENLSVQEMECEHPLCNPMHRPRWIVSEQRWDCPVQANCKPRLEWVVIDIATGGRAFDGETHETLKDAKAYATRRLDQQAGAR
jgi:hypothetical protein